MGNTTGDKKDPREEYKALFAECFTENMDAWVAKREQTRTDPNAGGTEPPAEPGTQEPPAEPTGLFAGVNKFITDLFKD